MKLNHSTRLILTGVLLFWYAQLSVAGTGSKLYNEFLDNEGFYDNDEWQEYVDALGQKLLSLSDDADKRYYFLIVDSPAVNAFATPDRYVFVNRGLLTFMESEDDLAAVIGHEIGHILARHGSRQKRTDLLGKSAGIAATLLTGRSELMEVSNATTKALLAGYGREMELRADQIGAELIAKAGYNPLAVINALHVLKDQSMFAKTVQGQPATYHGLFSTHPQHDKRLHDIVAYASEIMSEEIAEPIGDFWELMDGLKFGSEATVGLLANNVFYDRSARLVIEFPSNWFVRYNQQQVTGEQKGGVDVSWATVTRHLPDGEIDPKKFVRDTLKRTDIAEESTIEVNGKSTYLAELENPDESAKKLALLAVVRLGQVVYTVRGEAGPKGDEEQFKQDFIAILGGIRDMRPSDLKGDRSTKIKVIAAEPGVTYQALAQSTPLSNNAAQILRLLNGDYPNGEPRAGDYVKIVQ